ncbi:beta-lactamase/transpeptidase-like protein [Terfezia boudieri ATCC MYA-4762]|uniref:Beta-lactamase/transpeptidase-like protein n=1 Tax=Terfezia boudieri ATCC MYA-4762 TaxID=1051890 RepID=A0A3N4LM41_9PEZI|nr:beta-lactamase/transpeptidase-like protein [Terfezia boudieri ATCC MYA-4762]
MYPPDLRGAALLLVLLSFHPLLATAAKLMDYCSPPGPHIPYVSSDTLRNSPIFKMKLSELTMFLQKISDHAEDPMVHNDHGNPIGGINLAVAITTPTDTIYTFNHGLRLTLEGANPWTEHTIFRVASVSKALTVWEVVKLRIGWQEKVVSYLPELAEGRYQKEWSEVTVGALAGYVGGAMRDFEHDISQRPEHNRLRRRSHEGSYGSDGSDEKQNGYFIPEDTIRDIDGYVESIWAAYLPEFHPSEAWKMGFPPLEDVERDACFGNCTRKEFLNMLANHPLIYPTFTNPAYSNVGFSLLGLILERKTGLSFESLMQRDMYIPLGMKDTFHRLPRDAKHKPEGWGAHPYWGANDTWWETREIWGDWGVPAGGIFTSAHDLSIFLRTILAAFPYANDPNAFPNKYSVLSSARVREWLTPTAFTGGRTMLGRPWEIQRKKFSGCHGDRAFTIYNKAGGGTGYNAGITLIPELGIGVTILVAGDGGKFIAPNAISYSYHWKTIQRALFEDKGLLKAIERAAYEEAENQYLGEYLFNSFMFDGDDGTNPPLPFTKLQSGPIFSGLELIKDNGPGLRVKRWISNGTDFLQTLVKVKLQMGLRGVEGAVAVARAYPIGNIGSRGPRRWAEDWRVWFEWEWENLPEEPAQQPRGPIYRTQAPSMQKSWSREKSKIPLSNWGPLSNVPWKVYPEVLPGGDGRERNPSSPQHQGDESSTEEEMEDSSSIKRKGWAKPTKSSVSTSNSEVDSETWSNNLKRPWWRAKKFSGKNQRRRKDRLEEWVFPMVDEEVEQQMERLKLGKENKDHFRAYLPAVADNKERRGVSTGLSGERPMWWKDRYDNNEDLRKYRERKEYIPDKQQGEGEEDAGEGEKEPHGKTDRVINYTYKQSKAHGAGMPNDADDDDGEEYDDLDGI